MEIVNKVYCLGVEDRSPNVTVKVNLPAGTKKWFYTVTATKSQFKAESIRDNPTLFSIFPNLISERAPAASKASTPVYAGDGNCSVYFLKEKSDAQKFITPGGAFFYHSEYSKVNVPSAGVIIDNAWLCSGTQFIGLENSRAYHEMIDMYVVLTVVAIREKK